MARFLLVFNFILFFYSIAFSQTKKFEYNNNCALAYKQLMALKNEQAVLVLKKEEQQNPDNLFPDYLADYSDCLALLFNGDAEQFSKLKKNEDARLENLAQANHKDPWYRFCVANIYFHWALVYLRFGDQLKAAAKFRKSFLLLKENQKKFPDFEENKVLFGLEQAMAGAVPDSYQWISSLFGVKGDINQGVATIAEYLNAHPKGDAALQEEAMIYYVYLKFYLQNQPKKAWLFLNGKQYNEYNNLLRSFIKANIALNYRKAEVAHDVLVKASSIKEFSDFPILEYELAESELLQLDLSCESHYQSFLEHYKGAHFVKDAWLKMAWIAYLKNNKTQEKIYLEKGKTEGKNVSDADKQAYRFATNPIFPMPDLLRVRLLIDGGYYQKALATIQSIDKSKLTTLSQKLEYNFRYGRIFEELEKEETALIFYAATIAMGRNEKDYYAARAALQRAFIAERNGKVKDAIMYFKECLGMRHHDLQSSIDQQAKAGLNRLGA